MERASEGKSRAPDMLQDQPHPAPVGRLSGPARPGGEQGLVGRLIITAVRVESRPGPAPVHKLGMPAAVRSPPLPRQPCRRAVPSPLEHFSTASDGQFPAGLGRRSRESPTLPLPLSLSPSPPLLPPPSTSSLPLSHSLAHPPPPSPTPSTARCRSRRSRVASNRPGSSVAAGKSWMGHGAASGQSACVATLRVARNAYLNHQSPARRPVRQSSPCACARARASAPRSAPCCDPARRPCTCDIV